MLNDAMPENVASNLEAVGWSARERDLDNLLLEELAASAEFRGWLLSRLAGVLDPPPHVQTRARRNEDRDAVVGQTDLGFALVGEDGADLCLVLIENKIMSMYTPGQPERYRDEVWAARRRLGERRAAAVLIAPLANRFVRDHPGHRHFDIDIPLEDIADHFTERMRKLEASSATCSQSVELLARLTAKAELVDCLLGRRLRQRRHRNPDAARVDFLRHIYERAVARLGRDLEITDPTTGGPKSTTVLYTPRRQLPGGLPVKNIRHDFGDKDEVSIVLSGFAGRRDAVVASLADLPGARVDAGKSSRVVGRDSSLMVRLSTLPMDVERPADEQETEIEAALDRVAQLHDWATRHGGQLMHIVG